MHGGSEAGCQPIHTEVMIASATFKDGDMAGMPVPLHCTWYNISSDQSDFIQIPGVSGSCFQPSVDDIGFKILVHAIPATDVQEYQGMPMFKEVGPLVMDPAVESEADQLLNESPSIVFDKATLDSATHAEYTSSAACPVLLTILPYELYFVKRQKGKN